MVKKRIFVLCIFFTFFFSLFSLAVPVAAQNKITPTLGDYQKALGGDQYNKETFDFQSLVGLSSGLITMMAGCLDPSCPSGLKTGIIPTVNMAIAGIYVNPPASGAYYLADLGERMHIVKPAYAQTGTGFQVLEPFRNIWRAVRNITYILFVIGIVGLGLSIMFRTKISPQATITIQSALPRVVLALILVTFSYPIVGFLVDLLYLTFGLLVWGLQAAQLYSFADAQYYWNEYLRSDIGTTYGFIMSKGLEGAGDIFRSGTLPTWMLTIGGMVAVAAGILGFYTAAAPAMIEMASQLIPLVLGLAFAFLFFLFKVLLTLARAYLGLIIHLIFGPLMILFAVFTGRGVWEGWLRGVAANLLVFLGAGIIVFVVEILRRQIDFAWAANNLWGPPYLGANAMILNALIAFAGLAIIPSLPDMINQWLNIRPPAIQPLNLQGVVQQFSGTAQGIASKYKPRIPVPPAAPGGGGGIGGGP